MKNELLYVRDISFLCSPQNRMRNITFLISEGEALIFAGNYAQRSALSVLFRGDGREVSGDICIRGRGIKSFNRESFEKNGIFIVDKNSPYMKSLSISDNVSLLRKNSLRKFFYNDKLYELKLEKLFDRYGIKLDLKKPSDRLSRAEIAIINILRCISQGAELILLQDLSELFSEDMQTELLRIIDRIKENGISIIISDNHPERFFGIADGLYVFKHWTIAKKIEKPEDFCLFRDILMRGQVAGEIQHQERRLGRAVEIRFPGSGEIPITLREGEIRYLEGGFDDIETFWREISSFDENRISYSLNGKDISYSDIYDLISNRIVPFSYNDEIPDNLSIGDNIALPSIKRFSNKLGILDKDISSIFSEEWLMDGESLREDISGIRVLIYRWKLFHPVLLIAHNIFSSADLRDHKWIQKEILEMAERGTAVLIADTERPRF